MSPIVHDPDTLVLLDTIVEVIVAKVNRTLLASGATRHTFILVRGDSVRVTTLRSNNGGLGTSVAHPRLV